MAVEVGKEPVNNRGRTIFLPLFYLREIRMKRTCLALAVVGLILFLDLAAKANPVDANAFRGNVTGTVKSAQRSGLSFDLTISEAKADAKYAAKNDGSKMIGKTINLGVRTPIIPGTKNKAPSADDIAFIKSLKAGMHINVDIFALQANPNILRIQKPGKILGESAKPLTK